MTVVAGAAGPARPFHLVTVPASRRPVLIPGGAGGAEPAGPAGPVARPAVAVARPAAQVARSGPVRLTRRGRLVLVTLAAFVVVAVVAPAVAHLRSAATVPASAPAVVVVQPGDTLWSIAHRVAPDRDARLVVADLRRLNALASADLEVGQRLTIRAG
jgi:hypothetical protein